MSDSKQSNLERAFRSLREKWFNKAIRRYEHEREWETEEQQSRRVKENAERKEEFDQETDAIVSGDIQQ